MADPGFERQPSAGARLLCSSPLDTLVRRTSSRRQATKQQSTTSPPTSIHPPPAYAVPRPPFASQCIPDSPLLHSNFRGSTASATAIVNPLYTSQNSKSFLLFTDDCEPDDGDDDGGRDYYGRQRPPNTHNHYGTLDAPPAFATRPRPSTDIRPQATDLAQRATLKYADPEVPMYTPPSPLPMVIISSPQDEDPKPSGPMRQRIDTLNGPRLNFSRPSRPPVLSSEEQKRQVLERNAQRVNSPRMGPNPAFTTPVAPMIGAPPHMQGMPRHPPSNESSDALSAPLASSTYLHPHGHSAPSAATSNHITLPSHPPSIRVASSLSLYSNTYSFYQLDSAAPSPTLSQSSRSTPEVSPPPSRPASVEPQTAEKYLQLGIKFHEANQLRDSAVCFEKSAKEHGGCSVGMLMWGLTLRHGWGCEKNEKSAFKWLTRAAELAVVDLEGARKGLDARGVREELVLAIYEVGQCFFQGWGVAKDQKMAVSYYRVAAKLGDGDAQQDLAFCLANGKGCKKNKKEAAKWYRAAVAQGASDVGMAWIYKDKYKD